MSKHDLRFAARSVRYLRRTGSTDSEIRRVLRDDLGCPDDVADHLASHYDEAVIGLAA